MYVYLSIFMCEYMHICAYICMLPTELSPVSIITNKAVIFQSSWKLVHFFPNDKIVDLKKCIAMLTKKLLFQCQTIIQKHLT